LDPTAAIQISSTIIDVYQNSIDALINQLGKNTILTFPPDLSPCPNCSYDTVRKRSTGVYKIGGPTPFARGKRCPYCKGGGLLETAVQKCIKCLIKWGAKELEDYNISVQDDNNVVRLKTYLTFMDDLSRAETATVQYDSADISTLVVKRITDPIPVGLRYDKYCISFWEMV
jgi:hypothetical protein